MELLKKYISQFNAILIHGPICQTEIFTEKLTHALDLDGTTNIYQLDLSDSIDSVEKELEKIVFIEPRLRIFLAKNADMMSQTVANRLLKIVEEPPLNTKFVFLAGNKNKVIPTILSRTVELTQKQALPELVDCALEIKNNPIYKFFSNGFQLQDLPTLLELISQDQTDDLESVLEEVWTNASVKNNCIHSPSGCLHFCKLEAACKSLAKGKNRITSSKLVWQAVFCATLTQDSP